MTAAGGSLLSQGHRHTRPNARLGRSQLIQRTESAWCVHVVHTAVGTSTGIWRSSSPPAPPLWPACPDHPQTSWTSRRTQEEAVRAHPEARSTASARGSQRQAGRGAPPLHAGLRCAGQGRTTLPTRWAPLALGSRQLSTRSMGIVNLGVEHGVRRAVLGEPRGREASSLPGLERGRLFHLGSRRAPEPAAGADPGSPGLPQSQAREHGQKAQSSAGRGLPLGHLCLLRASGPAEAHGETPRCSV